MVIHDDSGTEPTVEPEVPETPDDDPDPGEPQESPGPVSEPGAAPPLTTPH